MKTFKELGITTNQKGFTGDKIKISKVLNRQIIVLGYKIENSKFNDGKCLHMQISLGDTKHIVFTGSKHLQELIGQVAKGDFPFTTTIIEENDRFEFT